MKQSEKINFRSEKHGWQKKIEIRIWLCKKYVRVHVTNIYMAVLSLIYRSATFGYTAFHKSH